MTKMKNAGLTAFRLIGVLVLVTAVVLGFVACAKPAPLWKANLSQDGVFNTNSGDDEMPYGSVTKNEDGTVTLKSSTANVDGELWAANTYFGEADKNFDYTNGMTVSYTVAIDPANMKEGKHSVWSLALNGTNGAYITELPTYFLGTENGVKFVYQFAGVDARNDVIKNENAYTVTQKGNYTASYKLTTAQNGELNVQVTLKDSNNKTVYTSKAETFEVIQNEGATPREVVKEDMIKGLRYLWLCRTNVDVVVSNIEITK